MMQSLFYCPDCDAHIGCYFRSHDAYIRCFGDGGHCLICMREIPAIAPAREVALTDAEHAEC